MKEVLVTNTKIVVFDVIRKLKLDLSSNICFTRI